MGARRDGAAGAVARTCAVGVIALVGLVGVADARPVAIVGGTVHPVSGPAIERGVVLFDEGEILAVGSVDAVDIPPSARRIDATERHVWPGMIDALSHLGLTEIGSVRGTDDMDEHGTMNPNARAEVALNVSSSHFPVTRANGVLLAATLPRGGLVAGTAAAIALDGWTAEEMVRRAPIGLVVYWPAMPSNAEADTAGGGWEAAVVRLDEMIDEARAYSQVRESEAARDADVRWESLRAVIAGDVPVWIHAWSLRQIRAAMDWTRKHGLRMVLLAGSTRASSDAPLCADELASRDIPVVVQTTIRPARRWEPYDTPYTVPARLHEAGVRVVFGSWSSSSVRNLPQEAARAAAYGLPRAAAERGVTLAAAKVLGIDDRYGSLEPGKSATFLVVDGDLLELRMQVDRAWLDGRELDLSSRHTKLWEKWSARPMPETTSNE